jgi:hypothetical protein
VQEIEFPERCYVHKTTSDWKMLHSEQKLNSYVEWNCLYTDRVVRRKLLEYGAINGNAQYSSVCNRGTRMMTKSPHASSLC